MTPGLASVELAANETQRLLVALALVLEDVRSVDRHRVDPQALDGLEERLPGSAEERDPFLNLGRLRPVLHEEDLGERVP